MSVPLILRPRDLVDAIVSSFGGPIVSHFFGAEGFGFSGESVIELLRELHQEGATICLVTHDSHYAECAERTIHLLDGRVIEESRAASLE